MGRLSTDQSDSLPHYTTSNAKTRSRCRTIIACSAAKGKGQNNMGKKHYEGHHQRGNIRAEEQRLEYLWDTPVYNQKLMDDALEEIGNKIVQEMERQDISGLELAEITGVNYSHIFKIVRGETAIGLRTLIKVSYALHVDIAKLMPTQIREEAESMSFGSKFENLVADIDDDGVQYLLNFCQDYSKEYFRIKNKYKWKMNNTEK